MLTNIQCCLAGTGPAMHICGDNATSESRLTQNEMEGDLYLRVQDEGLDEREGPVIVWVTPVEWLLPNAEVYEE